MFGYVDIIASFYLTTVLCIYFIFIGYYIIKRAKNLSKLVTCGHCGKYLKNGIIGIVNDIHEDDQYNHDENHLESSENYSVFKCPAFNGYKYRSLSLE